MCSEGENMTVIHASQQFKPNSTLHNVLEFSCTPLRNTELKIKLVPGEDIGGRTLLQNALLFSQPVLGVYPKGPLPVQLFFW